MRIGVVAYELEREPTGVGRYLAGLLHGVAELADEHEWVLFFQGEPGRHPLAGDPRFESRFGGDSGSAVVWEQLGLPRLLRRERLDLLFSPSYSLPPTGGVPAVVTIHDLSFEVLPAEFGLRERWRRRLLARRAVRRAARVLVDTPRMAEELSLLYRLPPGRIGVVPLGVELEGPRGVAEGGPRGAPARTVAATGSPSTDSPLAGGYLLALGTVFERRQPRLLLEVFAELARERPELRLVLAGANRLRRPEELDRAIAALELGGRVERLGYVAEEAVVPLYRGAELSFYVSSYEGFGLPPLESLACGTAAVVGPGTALDELWPDYPYRCALLDRPTVAGVAAGALADGEQRARVAAEGARRVGELTWRRAAQRFLEELKLARRSALAGSPPGAG
jgi:glycosyltransferase involved in cell wall biosynthesis